MRECGSDAHQIDHRSQSQWLAHHCREHHGGANLFNLSVHSITLNFPRYSVLTMKTIDAESFSLDDTLGCGQSFSWVREGEGYINADVGQVIYVEQDGTKVRYRTSSHPAPVAEMLGMRDPIDVIVSEISRDEIMRQAIDFAPGLRIVRDPFYPCLVSFICSIWKNIPAIRGMTDGLRKRWGPTYEFMGKTYHGMPDAMTLDAVSASDLKKLGLAWRADFLKKATRSILDGSVDPDELPNMEYNQAHRALTSLHGVGNKVADCVCLFSLGFLEAFPIDVWIERVIKDHYSIFSEAGKSYKKKSEAARAHFGRYAGYAQEYLYHYYRTRDDKC